jgi:hypothetical protein
MTRTGRRRTVIAIPMALSLAITAFAGMPSERATIVVVDAQSASRGGHPPGLPGAELAMFLETFDGAPSAPAPFDNLNGWDIYPGGLDVRQNGTAAQVAHHGPTCGPPGFPYTSSNTHPLHTTSDTVFTCNNHLMTATGLTGYGAIYMVPPAMADFSGGPAVISFDMSTLRTGSRDWVYFTLSPFHSHNKVFDGEDTNFPPDSINLRLEGGGNTFTGWQRAGGVKTRIDGDAFTQWDQVQEANGVTTSASRRDTFQITLSETHLRFCITGNNSGDVYTYRGSSGFCWIDTELPTPLSDPEWNGRATLMITHVSYNVEKSCSSEEDQFSIVHNPVGDANCPPNTWHWDNVGIRPAVPFTILSPLQRIASFSDPAGTNTVTFSAPAPDNSFLSYVADGECSRQRFSVDGGASWITALPQPSATQCQRTEAGEYFTPIPAGTTSVKVTGEAQFGRWSAAGITIWSAAGGRLPTVIAPPPTSQPPPVVVAPPSQPDPRARAPQLPAPGAYRSAWQSQSAYPAVAPGETATVTLRFQNTGTEPWISGVPGRQVNLGVVGDSRRFADLGMASGWLSADRPTTAAEAIVLPGDSGTFSFSVKAPAEQGLYRIPLRLVADGVAWLDDQGVYVDVLSDHGYHSAWVWQSPWPTIRAGEVATVTVQFRNTGTRSWVRAGRAAAIGIVGDDTTLAPLGVNWVSPNRPAVQSEAEVGPGALGTFTFDVRGPVAPATYVLPLQLVVDGITWLEDDGVYVPLGIRP